MALIRLAQAIWAEEEGQSLTEYALVMGLVAVVCVGALGLMGTNINSMLQSVGNSIKPE